MLRRGYAVHFAGLCECVCVCTAGGRRQKISNDVIKHVISFDWKEDELGETSALSPQ
jgi:hypothetical protein